MLSAALARELSAAGLGWTPAEGDRVLVPDGSDGERVVLLSSLVIEIQLMNGEPAICFHGTSEWALDYLMVSEALWLPSETQLRGAIEGLAPRAALSLSRSADGVRYVCAVGVRRGELASTAEDAYALALLILLAERG